MKTNIDTAVVVYKARKSPDNKIREVMNYINERIRDAFKFDYMKHQTIYELGQAVEKRYIVSRKERQIWNSFADKFPGIHAQVMDTLFPNSRDTRSSDEILNDLYGKGKWSIKPNKTDGVKVLIHNKNKNVRNNRNILWTVI